MCSSDPSFRQTYTPSQLQEYFERIALPERYLSSPIITGAIEEDGAPHCWSPSSSLAKTKEHGLPLVTAIQRYQLAAVPFENLNLHYSNHARVLTDPQNVFGKIVGRKAMGRGGRCMEANSLLEGVLRSLGYDVITGAARVNEAVQPASAAKNWAGPRYNGWNHKILMVIISGVTYLVDAGMAANSPTRPMPIPIPPAARQSSSSLQQPPESDLEYTTRTIGTQESRISYGPIPDSSVPLASSSSSSSPLSQNLYTYSVRYAPTKPWIPCYCFTLTEFLPADYEMMSYYTSTNRRSWFTTTVVCGKMIMADGGGRVDDQGEGEGEGEGEIIIGDITLFGDTLKRRVMGKREILCQATSEPERVRALQEHLGVKLDEVEVNGIRGLATDLG